MLRLLIFAIVYTTLLPNVNTNNCYCFSFDTHAQWLARTNNFTITMYFHTTKEGYRNIHGTYLYNYFVVTTVSVNKTKLLIVVYIKTSIQQYNLLALHISL